MKLGEKSLLQAKKECTPEQYAALLKQGGPVYFWEKGGFWVVTDFKLAEEVLRSPKYTADRRSFFVTRMPDMDLSLIQDFFGVVAKMMVMSDGKDHLVRRKITAMGLTDELLEIYKPKIQRTVAKLVDDCLKKDVFDFATDISEKLPSVILADLFEIPDADRPNFFKWSINMTQFFGGASSYQNADGIEVNSSAKNLKNYFTALLAKRRLEPSTDFFSHMVKEQSQFGLTDDELISQAIMLLVAGQVTTTDQLCSNFYTYLSLPEVQEQLLVSPHLIPLALEEFNRLDPAVTYIFRVVKEETTLGGNTLPLGAVIFISTHAVNRDEKVFSNADDCQIDRKYNPHFAFGHGTHFCLGAKLARIEMQTLFTEIIKRLPTLKFAEPAIRRHYSLAFSGFESLKVSTCLSS